MGSKGKQTKMEMHSPKSVFLLMTSEQIRLLLRYSRSMKHNVISNFCAFPARSAWNERIMERSHPPIRV